MSVEVMIIVCSHDTTRSRSASARIGIDSNVVAAAPTGCPGPPEGIPDSTTANRSDNGQRRRLYADGLKPNCLWKAAEKWLALA